MYISSQSPMYSLTETGERPFGEVFSGALNIARQSERTDETAMSAAWARNDEVIRSIDNGQDMLRTSGMFAGTDYDKRLAELRAQDSRWNDVKTTDEIRRDAIIQTQEKERLFSEYMAGANDSFSNRAAMFAGGLVGSTLDGMTLASGIGAGIAESLIPVGKLAGMAKLGLGIATAGVTGGMAESFVQPEVAKWQQALGKDYGLAEMERATVETGLSSGAMFAGFDITGQIINKVYHGLRFGGKKAGELHDLSKTVGEHTVAFEKADAMETASRNMQIVENLPVDATESAHFKAALDDYNNFLKSMEDGEYRNSITTDDMLLNKAKIDKGFRQSLEALGYNLDYKKGEVVGMGKTMFAMADDIARQNEKIDIIKAEVDALNIEKNNLGEQLTRGADEAAALEATDPDTGRLLRSYQNALSADNLSAPKRQSIMDKIASIKSNAMVKADAAKGRVVMARKTADMEKRVARINKDIERKTADMTKRQEKVSKRLDILKKDFGDKIAVAATERNIKPAEVKSVKAIKEVIEANKTKADETKGLVEADFAKMAKDFPNDEVIMDGRTISMSELQQEIKQIDDALSAMLGCGVGGK